MAIDTADAHGGAADRAAPVNRTRRRFLRGIHPMRPIRTTVIGRLVQLLWIAVGVLDAILVLDFVFRLIGARASGFSGAILGAGSYLASPYDGIFANVAASTPYTLTWSDAVALVLYTLAGWVVVRLIRISGPRERRA
jgi:hypothetical protein